jgi:hypothetical protein
LLGSLRRMIGLRVGLGAAVVVLVVGVRSL